jgi:hypothetical protein
MTPVSEIVSQTTMYFPENCSLFAYLHQPWINGKRSPAITVICGICQTVWHQQMANICELNVSIIAGHITTVTKAISLLCWGWIIYSNLHWRSRMG